jgi:hypothetical protein
MVDKPLERVSEFFNLPAGQPRSRKGKQPQQQQPHQPTAPATMYASRGHEHHRVTTRRQNAATAAAPSARRTRHPVEPDLSRFLNNRVPDMLSTIASKVSGLRNVRISRKKPMQNAATSINGAISSSISKRCKIDQRLVQAGHAERLISRYTAETGKSRDYADHHMQWLAMTGSLSEFQHTIDSMGHFAQWIARQPDMDSICKKVSFVRQRRRMAPMSGGGHSPDHLVVM